MKIIWSHIEAIVCHLLRHRILPPVGRSNNLYHRFQMDMFADVMGEIDGPQRGNVTARAAACTDLLNKLMDRKTVNLMQRLFISIAKAFVPSDND